MQVLSIRSFETRFIRNSVRISDRDAVIPNGRSVLAQGMSKNSIPGARSKVYCKEKSPRDMHFSFITPFFYQISYQVVHARVYIYIYIYIHIYTVSQHFVITYHPLMNCFIERSSRKCLLQSDYHACNFQSPAVTVLVPSLAIYLLKLS